MTSPRWDTQAVAAPRPTAVLFDAGATLEHELVALGHYNDKRNSKGVEIESVPA